MRSERLLPNATWLISLILGQASLLMGLTFSLGWAFAFVLMIPRHSVSWTDATGLSLPMIPPLVGMALGAAGFLLARFYQQSVIRYSIAGMLLNTIPLSLALVLRFLSR